MSIKHKVVKIESEYFEKSCDECKEYIDKIMKKTKDPEKTFVIYLINQGSDLSKIHNVNNAVYLQLFEEARWDFMDKNGYGLADIQANKKGPVVLSNKLGPVI